MLNLAFFGSRSASIGYNRFEIQENCGTLRKQTLRARTYLDCNATHPLLPEAKSAIISALEYMGNPSSVHQEGRAARGLIDQARTQVASLVNAKPDHVTFTSGASESANIVLTPHWQMGRAALTMCKLYVSATEHPAVLAGGRFSPADIKILPVLPSGELALDNLVQQLVAHDMSAGLPLVAVQHANNETGVVQPIAAIATIVRAHGGVLVVDAVQTFGRIPLDVNQENGDFFIVSSHKIGGPKGAGALIGVTDLMMPKPLIRGGGQEKGHRSGTEALPTIVGFGAAAFACKERVERGDIMLAKRQAIESLILSVDRSAIIHGQSASERLPNTVFFSMPGLKSETAHIAFDLAGIALSAGSACSSGKVGPSHVLKALGFDQTEGALRVSICLETTDIEIAAFGEALKTIAGRRATTRFAA
jgi:cysteine desulfurase